VAYLREHLVGMTHTIFQDNCTRINKIVWSESKPSWNKKITPTETTDSVNINNFSQFWYNPLEIWNVSLNKFFKCAMYRWLIFAGKKFCESQKFFPDFSWVYFLKLFYWCFTVNWNLWDEVKDLSCTCFQKWPRTQSGIMTT